jgi:hypothetical protein
MTWRACRLPAALAGTSGLLGRGFASERPPRRVEVEAMTESTRFALRLTERKRYESAYRSTVSIVARYRSSV